MTSGGQDSRALLKPLVLLAIALLVLSLLWNVPVARGEYGFTVAPVALEVVIVFVAIGLVPHLRAGRFGTGIAVLAAILTTLVVVLKVSDLAMREILGRPLNPLLDVRLLDSVNHLLTGVLGNVLGWVATAALVLLPLLIVAFVYTIVRRVQRALADQMPRRVTLAACAALAAFAMFEQPSETGSRIVTADASVTLRGYARAAGETIRGIAEVERIIAEDRFEQTPPSHLLRRLRGADVILLFVESYGRGALDMRRYAGTIPRTLDAFEQRLAARGLSAASGWLVSPTVGGQSWLANGTFTNGLWLPDQGRYDAAIRSTRLTLVRAFSRAGYRTVALKPAIIHAWPEGQGLGFTRVYAAADLGYAGKPYNWITMPDQYTLSALQRDEPTSANRPLFAEVSLISSHTPWTPVPPVLEDWGSIGDGRVFSRWAEDGYSPDDVWSDIELMQLQYGRSIEYVLKVLASYAENFVGARTLLIVVGDHQPSPLVTGEGAGADVPMHVISGNPELLAPFEAWGFSRGMRPSAQLEPKRMDTFRDFFFEAFSAP